MLTSDPWTQRDLTMPDVNTLTRNAAKEAYEKAGVGPQDLDLIELHDCFATAELLHYENLGICGEGEAGRMVDEGGSSIGGKIPGERSAAASSQRAIRWARPALPTSARSSRHLRGEAGDRQVEGAKVGMAHVIGLGSACTIHILTA